MFASILNTVLYSGIFTATIASFLSILTFYILNNDIVIYRIFLIFSGTLFIYNLDHIIDIKPDRTTNPQRSRYIHKNKSGLILLTTISGIIAACIFYSCQIRDNLMLIPVFLFGIFHWKFKSRKLFSAFYITCSWLLVVVIFPLSNSFEFNINIAFLLLILGLTIMGNALVFMADDMNTDKKNKTVYCSKLLVLAALLFSLISPDNLKFLLFIPALTLLALFFYRQNEKYVLLYLDGALLLGGILCILTDGIFIHLSR